MFRSNLLFALACAIILATSNAFAPKPAGFQPALSIQAASPPVTIFKTALRMSEEKSETEETPSTAVAPTSGTFYDDEVDSAPVKQGISDNMRARLMAEASTGLDADSAQTNVLLYICLGVAVLVIVGGAGILY